MRKVGKYEKMRKNALLSSYITSVLCLVLCVTMFFGTTAAWFTDTTTSEQNQIYVGTLAVDLGFAAVTKESNGQETTYTAVAETVPIFDDSIRWEPGYTAIRKFELTEKGDLAFSYQMGIERTFTDAEVVQKAIAEHITVWQYVGDNAEAYTLPVDFETMTVDNEEEWVLVGTLKQVIDNHIPVFTGKMDNAAVAADQAKAYHLIALNMDKNYDGAVTKDENNKITSSIQGQKLENITIKLVATQLPSEEDAFGPNYDRMPANIVVIKEVKKDANNKVTEKVELAATNNSAVSYASVEIPEGAQVTANATTLALKVEEKKEPNITVASDRKVLPLDIKVEGFVSNDQLIPVKLQLDKGLTNVEVFHDKTAMKTIATTNNDEYFTYNADTGLLTLYVKSFSPFDVVYRDDGVAEVATSAELEAAVKSGVTKILLADGEYDLNGIQKNDLTLIGDGDNVKMANTTRFASGKAVGAITKAIHLENMTITNTVYTMENGSNATFTNVNFAAGFRQGYGKAVVFDNCSFGSNSEGYALHFQTDNASEGGEIKLTGCEFEGGKVHLGGKRAYTFSGCDFAEGTDFQVWSNITLENCTVNGVKVTAENMTTLFPKLDTTKVIIK